MNDKKQKQIKTLLAKADALLESLKMVYETDRDSGSFGFVSHKSFIQKHNALMSEVTQVVGTDFNVYLIDDARVPDWANSLPGQRRNAFDAVLLNLNTVRAELKELSGNISAVDDLRLFIRDKLRAVIHKPPSDEHDIQDAIETLLIGRGYAKGVDYDRETGRVKPGTKESTPDFIFPRLALALEVKFLKTSRDRQRSVDEINADIQSYGKKYDTIIFIVYDQSTIRDESEYKQNIADGVRIFVEVVKH